MRRGEGTAVEGMRMRAWIVHPACAPHVDLTDGAMVEAKLKHTAVRVRCTSLASIHKVPCVQTAAMDGGRLRGCAGRASLLHRRWPATRERISLAAACAMRTDHGSASSGTPNKVQRME